MWVNDLRNSLRNVFLFDGDILAWQNNLGVLTLLLLKSLKTEITTKFKTFFFKAIIHIMNTWLRYFYLTWSHCYKLLNCHPLSYPLKYNIFGCRIIKIRDKEKKTLQQYISERTELKTDIHRYRPLVPSSSESNSIGNSSNLPKLCSLFCVALKRAVFCGKSSSWQSTVVGDKKKVGIND